MSIKEFAERLNELGATRSPFLFFVDFEMLRPVVMRLDEVDAGRILYDINGRTNFQSARTRGNENEVTFQKFPCPFQDYKKKFDKVWAHLIYGDSYLTNLTIRTRIDTPLSLKEIFAISQAKYKLWFDDQFLVFSPETFVRISDGRIFSFPMKGTIDASLPDAENKIINDPKETAEHVTIVDLIRNDLSAVADDIRVARFRYVEKISTMQKDLLQVSSEISAKLADGWAGRLGDVLVKLMPAGSVTGAPKCKTLEIIREAEAEPRGYYTGVVGIFDGEVFDSGVMIRYLERSGKDLYYRSGGGITVQSVVETEYQEAIDKVYVPVD